MQRSFGPYEVLEQVATGGTGIVYRARHTELDREAAVKELHAYMRSLPGFSERMRHEAQVLGTLDHPNIVRIYDYVEEPDRTWLAEEWIQGVTLDRLLEQHGQLTPEQSVGVVRGALLGLSHAHEHGIVHRDIAPGNVLADMAGTSMLVDFGLAARVGDTTICGTPAFMSPEAVRGEPVRASSDVYSAACVLFLLLSGRTPFPGHDSATILKGHLEDTAPELRDHGSEMRDLLQRSMAKDPSARPQTAAAFLAELERAAESRFGAGWLQRSSIASLVSAAIAGSVAVVGGAATSSTTSTVLLDSAAGAAHVGTQAIKAGGRSRALTAAIAGGAALAVIAGAGTVTYALTNRGDESSQPSASVTTGGPTTTAAPTTKAPTLEERAPSGVATFRQTVVASDVPGIKVGKTAQRTWRFSVPECSTDECEGHIASNSGSRFSFTWAGAGLIIDDPKTTSQVVTCVDTDTGKPQKGTSVRVTVQVNFFPLRPAERNSDGRVTKYVGREVIRYSYSDYVDCNKEPTHRAVYRVELILR